jgi:hypothetical protein
MRRFLRVLKEDGVPEYINVDRIERIEIQQSVTHALVFLIGKTEPLVVKSDSYDRLIEILGNDQEAD